MTHRVSDIEPPDPGIVRDAGRQNRTIGGIFHRNGSLLHPAAAGELDSVTTITIFIPTKFFTPDLGSFPHNTKRRPAGFFDVFTGASLHQDEAVQDKFERSYRPQER